MSFEMECLRLLVNYCGYSWVVRMVGVCWIYYQCIPLHSKTSVTLFGLMLQWQMRNMC